MKLDTLFNASAHLAGIASKYDKYKEMGLSYGPGTKIATVSYDCSAEEAQQRMDELDAKISAVIIDFAKSY